VSLIACQMMSNCLSWLTSPCRPCSYIPMQYFCQSFIMPIGCTVNYADCRYAKYIGLSNLYRNLCHLVFSMCTSIILCAFVAVCKSCVVKYLQSSKCCPQCGLKIHETQPLLNLKPDRVMQDIVFKLVPGLYESEFMFYLK